MRPNTNAFARSFAAHVGLAHDATAHSPAASSPDGSPRSSITGVRRRCAIPDGGDGDVGQRTRWRRTAGSRRAEHVAALAVVPVVSAAQPRCRPPRAWSGQADAHPSGEALEGVDAEPSRGSTCLEHAVHPLRVRPSCRPTDTFLCLDGAGDEAAGGIVEDGVDRAGWLFTIGLVDAYDEARRATGGLGVHDEQPAGQVAALEDVAEVRRDEARGVAVADDWASTCAARAKALPDEVDAPTYQYQSSSASVVGTCLRVPVRAEALGARTTDDVQSVVPTAAPRTSPSRTTRRSTCMPRRLDADRAGVPDQRGDHRVTLPAGDVHPGDLLLSRGHQSWVELDADVLEPVTVGPEASARADDGRLRAGSG